MSAASRLTVSEAERKLDDMVLDLSYAGHLVDLLIEIAGDALVGSNASPQVLQARERVTALGRAVAIHVRDTELAVSALRGGMDRNGFQQERTDEHAA